MGDKLICIVTRHNAARLKALAEALATITPKPLEKEREFSLERADTRGKKAAFCPIGDCEGKIAGADMGLYPPGVPNIMRGEVIDKKAARFIKENASRLFGLAYGRVVVLE